MIPADRFFFVGLMGSGKTTLGRVLARNRGMECIDSDHEIVARCGVSIPTIFEIEGEAGFRLRETAIIDELTQRQDIVLATGGGAILDPINRAHLKARGTVIYLHGTPHELYQRTRGDRNRPLLQTEDPLARMTELYHARHPLYLEVADITLDTGRQSVHTLVALLERQLVEVTRKATPPSTPLTAP
jgi:shikimate kinase